MRLRFLGGAGEVGRSALLVNDRLLLDYGMKATTPPRFPTGAAGTGGVDPEAVVVSHGHLDHAGAVPALLSGGRPPVHWTPPTREFARLLARDTLKLHGNTLNCPFTGTDVERIGEVSVTHGYREPFEAAGHTVEFLDAGHIPGSAHVLVDDGDTRLLYTGDFHTDSQRLVAGTTARPEADVVVTESTYADTERAPRAELERRFAESVRTALWEGGTVVVPAFAVGRTQEMLLVCEEYDIPCYVDGMGKRVTRLLRGYPEFVRDTDALDRAAAHARFVTGGDGQRRRIADQQAAIVTTSGMLSGGPAMVYLPEIRRNPTNKVCLTGYQVEGTPGRQLLDTGSVEIDGRTVRVGARVESYDFSAHADGAGLRSFLRDYRGAEVLAVHGDDTAGFAADLRAEGLAARAPENGEELAC